MRAWSIRWGRRSAVASFSSKPTVCADIGCDACRLHNDPRTTARLKRYTCPTRFSAAYPRCVQPAPTAPVPAGSPHGPGGLSPVGPDITPTTAATTRATNRSRRLMLPTGPTRPTTARSTIGIARSIRSMIRQLHDASCRLTDQLLPTVAAHCRSTAGILMTAGGTSTLWSTEKAMATSTDAANRTMRSASAP
jgi:hypothetical protein